ncbi:hypothetical protein NPIL_237381 [Nephila pilipes]|uniref:Uncharacterized protein n=1 Tax=Nephila pilipes TaxID=299642 RepID=A0A8X6Q3B0_NEPPI|nr:hypothetical protein NPIL_237381 [Nephila pilipes]
MAYRIIKCSFNSILVKNHRCGEPFPCLSTYTATPSGSRPLDGKGAIPPENFFSGALQKEFGGAAPALFEVKLNKSTYLMG